MNRCLVFILVLFALTESIVANTTPGCPVRNPRHLPKTVDFIVLGGGTAGSVVASKLSEDPNNKVLLIEAGTDQSDNILTQDPNNWADIGGSPIDWHDVVALGEPHVTQDLQRRRITGGRVLGGSSSINSAMYVRSDGHNFDRWSQNGNSGWSYNEVLPFFKEVEHSDRVSPYHSSAGPLRVTQGFESRDADQILIDAAVNAGLTWNDDWNGASQITGPLGSVGYHEYTIYNTTRQNSYASFLKPHLCRKNLFVYDMSLVLKINIDKQKRARSVDWLDTVENTVITTKARHDIVLSLGTMRSSQILRISGVGDQTELENLGIDVVHHLPGVGKNVKDHPIMTFNIYAPNVPPCEPSSRTIGTRVSYFLRTKFREATDPRPDIQIHAITPCPNIFVLLYILSPNSTGEIMIYSKNPTERPAARINFFDKPEDLDVMIEGFRRTLNIFAQHPINGTLVEPLDPNDDNAISYYIRGGAWTQSNTNSGMHLVGSCKMGPASDPMAVVDHRLRVHGIQNLRVADASIMPDITTGNTQAPTYMIGAKCAHMILQDL